MASTSKSHAASALGTSSMSVADHVELGKKAFALKQLEQAIEHYGNALELVSAQHGEMSNEYSDLLYPYGKALLEHAIAQSAVLGKEEQDENDNDDSVEGDPRFSFSGDGDDATAEGDEDGEGVDLFAEATKAVEQNDAQEAEQVDEQETDDDFAIAWEILDLARAAFEKRAEFEGDEAKFRLSDIHMALGDISLETEKFEEAIADYTVAVGLKSELLPLSSRQLAEAHYRLCIVLDMQSGRLSDAIEQASLSLQSIETRIVSVQEALARRPKSTMAHQLVKSANGKGKATGPSMSDNSLGDMNQEQLQSELKDLEQLKEDLNVKIEELKSSPNEQPLDSAPALAAKELDLALNHSASHAGPSNAKPVNDLTGMVKRKQKQTKRKGDDDDAESPPEKKIKLDDKLLD